MIGNFTKLCYAMILSSYCVATLYLVVCELSRCLAMLSNCFTRCCGKILSTKLNELPGWIGCLAVERMVLPQGPCPRVISLEVVT